MERALKVFSEHSNMRFFMLGIINCNHTPFIFTRMAALSAEKFLLKLTSSTFLDSLPTSAT